MACQREQGVGGKRANSMHVGRHGALASGREIDVPQDDRDRWISA